MVTGQQYFYSLGQYICDVCIELGLRLVWHRGCTLNKILNVANSSKGIVCIVGERVGDQLLVLLLDFHSDIIDQSISIKHD